MHQHEKINYIEFQSHDFTATKAFFKAVFGWEFTDYGDDYVAIHHAGIDGGFYQSAQSSRPANGAMLVVFYSDNLHTTRQKIIEAGGSISQDIFSFPGGQRFHFLDPSGNEFAVWSDAHLNDESN